MGVVSFADPSRAAPCADPVVIVAGADDRFAMGLTVALSSAVRHLDRARPGQVYVLDGGLSEDSRARCLRAILSARPDVVVTFVENDPARFSGYDVHRYSRAAYLRLMIPDIVPEGIGRVLYIDSDVVVTDDVGKLWDLPDDGCAFWVAHDDGVKGKGYFGTTLAFAGLPADTPYFNSGVMLMNLPRWREERISERAQALLAEHSDKCVNVDQDALNLVGVGRWSALSPRWNFQVEGARALSPALPAGESVAVTHYINEKPWNEGRICLRQDVFDKAVMASGWFSGAEKRQYRKVRGRVAKRAWLRHHVPFTGARHAAVYVLAAFGL